MFKRLTYIKNFGVFREYKWPAEVQEFKKINIIYGWNYSGKTTLARIFQCFEKEEIHKDYSNCEFELLDQDNRKYSKSNLIIPGKKVRVFNTDFIQKNLNWDGQDFEPILLLGEETKNAVKSIAKTQKRIDKITTIQKERNNRIQELSDEIYKSKKEKAKYINDTLRLVEQFTQTHLNPVIDEVRSNYAEFIVDSPKKRVLLREATATEENKLDILPEFSCTIEMSRQIEEVKKAVNKIPKFSQIIDYFVENPAVATWVEQGLPLHEQKNSCEYCGNTISQERRDNLLAHFSDDLKQHKFLLEQLITKIKSSKPEAPKTTSKDFYTEVVGFV